MNNLECVKNKEKKSHVALLPSRLDQNNLKFSLKEQAAFPEMACRF